MATRSKRLRQLGEIYAELPSVACKGLCHNACGAVPVYPLEHEVLEAASTRPLDAVQGSPTDNAVILLDAKGGYGVCQLLVAKRCSVYAQRPFICRIYGVAEGLPCQHGCVPTRVMPDTEVREVQKKLAKL